MKSCVSKKNYSLSWKCFTDMSTVNRKPNLESWNLLIEVLCKYVTNNVEWDCWYIYSADQIDLALSHLREMEKQANKEAKKREQINILDMNLNDLESPFPNGSSYGCIIVALSRARRVIEAEKLFIEMRNVLQYLSITNFI